ncbi:HIT family protein [Amycolatopsis sp. FDAARGOS 1241]|uniref:HIT family protein n=1 Tax=Amycolatopsis sp. FDAARGOS 1241 TaxID=2778070 RepID=UPI0019502824|nr:HIT domain-containing protein [Amycolatopsis sp. FDAARGOS 1241]QRP47019.1 HIT domain-containing protein [Amycolatopsis sp. FDAARGOS 1241]
MDNALVNCVFCGLLESGSATWLSRGPHAAAFLPLPASALAPGHTLVVPREHCTGVLDATDAALHHTISLVRRVGDAMTRALGATGVNVLNASGPGSGQSVAHLHFHVVPRWPDDGTDLWPDRRSSHPATGDEHQRLARALNNP